VLSNRVVNDLWDMIGVRTGRTEDLAYPPEAAPGWLARFADDPAPDYATVAKLVADPRWPMPRDAVVNPIEVLTRAVRVQRQMHQVSLDVLNRDPDVSVFMVYVAGFDNIAHAFWQYRFPEDYSADPPARADVDMLGPVLDRYLELFDRQLGELIAAFPEEPNVLVVSDHGYGPTDSATMWRGWHSSRGIFLAAGPDITPRDHLPPATYFDVVPTIVQLAGFLKPNDLTGRSLVAPAASERLVHNSRDAARVPARMNAWPIQRAHRQ
jgi:predicted AlkP superfamily phosphohydrolase/phosphomutase